MAKKEEQSKQKPITSIEEFIHWINDLKGYPILYRGMGDCEQEVESSGLVRVRGNRRKDVRIAPTEFLNYITRLLDRARKRGYGRRNGAEISDLELLADLQHHGAATCLIDFTSNPLVALWFACADKPENADKPERDGIVIAMRTDNTKIFAEVTHGKQMDKDEGKIKKFITEEKIWKWEPAYTNNRIVAQRSSFIFGKSKIDKQYYEAITIEKGCKKSILGILRHKYDIVEDTLFMDFPGFSFSNARNKSYEPDELEDYFKLGMAAHRKGDFKKSIDYYDKAIELNPNAGAYYNRGISKKEAGDIQGALKDYSKVIEIDPKNAWAYYSRGIAKKETGNLQGALEDYNKAIEIDPKNAWAYNNRGIAKKEAGNLQGALEDYSKAIEIDLNHVWAYHNRGNAKEALGDIQGALEDYSKIIEIDPNHVWAYYSRGSARKALGDIQGTLKDYSKVIEIDPKNAWAYNNRGSAKKVLGDVQGALEDYNKAAEIDPNYALAYYNRGNTKKEARDIQGALEDYSKVIEIYPNYALAYYSRGNAKKELGDVQGALEDYSKAIEIYPNYAWAYYNRAIVKSVLGDKQGAQEDFKKAHELDPTLIPPTNSPK